MCLFLTHPLFEVLSLSRLQVLIFSCDICDAGTFFLRIEVVMTDDDGLWVVPVQCFKQSPHGLTLCLGARVGWSAPDVQPTLVADAYRVGVVALAVGSCEPFRSSSLYLSVTTDDEVVAYAEVESPLAVPRIYLGCRTGLVGTYCRAVNHYHCYPTHDCTNRAELMAVRMVITTLIIDFQFNFFIISLFTCFLARMATE